MKENLKIYLYGGSHEEEIGVTVHGLPLDMVIDEESLQDFVNRRSPGRNSYSSQRKEEDKIIIKGGMEKKESSLITTGEPITLAIENTDIIPGEYDTYKVTPRPGHADYTGLLKYGPDFNMSGGGPFSGRMTAPICMAGGIILQYLEKEGIVIGAHSYMVKNVFDMAFEELNLTPKVLKSIRKKDYPVYSDLAGESQMATIKEHSQEGDSIGGIVEFAILGVPRGLGGPMFERLEAKLGKMLFSIPSVKGVEFGSGFRGAALLGSENNDAFFIKGDEVFTKTNNHGGLLGGVTSGMPITGNVSIKPTSSISIAQNTVNLETLKEEEISINGRHDPCIVPRAVPVVESMLAIAIGDLILGLKEDM